MWIIRPLRNISVETLLQNNKYASKRYISATDKLLKEESDKDFDHPLRRTVKVLGEDFKSIRNFFQASPKPTEVGSAKTDPKTGEFQTHCDVLIIGGGGIGLSISYWLKEKTRNGLNVVVVEKDPTYMKSLSEKSFHGIHQNFIVPENIQMGLYGVEFMRNINDHLGAGVNLNFTPYGSLRLASEENAEVVERISKVQIELGVRNELLSPEKIKAKFPWLNTEDVVLGCHGLEREGWIDPLALLFGYRNKALEYGVHLLNGEVVDFEFQSQSNVLVDFEEATKFEALDKAVVKLPSGDKRSIKFALCVIAGGSNSGKIARLARIGNAPGLLSIPLPLEPRKRNKYIFSSLGQQMPSFSTPLTIDPSGCYFTPQVLSGDYVCGRNTEILNQTPDVLKSGHDIFAADIIPILSQRVNVFKNARLKNSWTETCEYNTFDENGIIGTHPYYNNLYIAAGFNRHGIQLTPAVGRGISELIIDGRYRTIDLTRLSFDRFVVEQPLYEVSTIC